jgi:hypothetical protein
MAYQSEDAVVFNQVVDLLLNQGEWQQKERALHLLKNSARKDELTALFAVLQQDLNSFDSEKRYHMEDYLGLLELEYQIDTLNDSLRIVNIIANQDLLESLMTSEFTEGRVAAELLLEEADLDEKEALHIQLPNPEDAAERSTNNNEAKAKSYNFASMPNLVEVYPNPVDDKLTVEYIMFGGMTANTLNIYDINGKLLMTKNITKAMDIIDINVSQLSAGTYILSFGKEEANSSSTKFIVK